jgi:tetratricopeptide (TPR) repeat protein
MFLWPAVRSISKRRWISSFVRLRRGAVRTSQSVTTLRMKRRYLFLSCLTVGLPGSAILCAALNHEGGPTKDRPASVLPESAFEEHDFSEAQRGFKSILKTNANNARAKLFLGRIALEEERFDDGVQWLEQATASAPTNANVFLWLGRAYGLQARAAGITGGAGPARRAKAAFEKAIALDPNLIEARENLVMFYREAPRIIGGGRKFAIAEAEQIKKRDPYMGLLVHGDILMDARKYADAARIHQQAIELKPNCVEAWYRLGILLTDTKQVSKAFEAFDKILELNCNEQRVLYYLGKASALSGQQLTQGEEALKAYLQIKPWYIMPPLSAAHFYLGRVYEREGKSDEARTEYKATLKLNPACSEAKAGLRRLQT